MKAQGVILSRPLRRLTSASGELEGTTVTCPCHGAEFDVRTGGVLGPPAATGVKSYPFKLTVTRPRLAGSQASTEV